MDYRFLGISEPRVPVLGFVMDNFGGEGDFFKTWGNTQPAEVQGLIDTCINATADATNA
ncbi:hypothetical protein H8S90_01005 [Olivibacter sp. SDN3]|uniref:hypothetical protein n=1 Tax=Olivibacter sp. SDN3 TaxID=2764720 RepID=UPI001650D875|nr:hypothetical protein [Olivibacter sp. SDN3]QNL50242.1 hypothetical protein H8S90_01005 [Olivibacter sp. SDN3]